MGRNFDRIAGALELIAAQLALIASQLDPEALEKRKTAMFEQLAHDPAEDPAEKSVETS